MGMSERGVEVVASCQPDLLLSGKHDHGQGHKLELELDMDNPKGYSVKVKGQRLTSLKPPTNVIFLAPIRRVSRNALRCVHSHPSTLLH